MPVRIGLKHEQTLPVSPDIAVDFMGVEGARVLGTPFLIMQLEMAARNAVLTALEPGCDTVGTLVNVRHLAATPLGMNATFRAEVIAVEGRLIRFKVEAFDENEQIAEGVHERTIIDVGRFTSKVQTKLGQRIS